MLSVRRCWLLVFVIALAPLGVRAQHVVINEIMYAPTSPEPEWIEILNAGPGPVEMSSLALRVGSKQVALPDGMLGTGEFIVVARDTLGLRQTRGEGFRAAQCAVPSLRNTGDTIVLLGTSVLDSVVYSPGLGGKAGRSLERRADWLDGWVASSWSPTIDSTGATPGRPNSVAVAHIDLTLRTATWRFIGDSIIVSARVQNAGTNTIEKLLLRIDSGPALEVDEPVAMDSSLTVDLGAVLPNESMTLRLSVSTAGDERTSNDTLRLFIPNGLSPGSVVINEILSAPLTPEPEWIELYDPSPEAEWLDGCSLYVNSSRTTITARSIDSNNYTGLTTNDSLLAALRGVDRSRLIQIDLPTLSNSGASVRLVDARGRLVDSVRYAATAHLGHSLKRIDPYVASPDTSGWLPSLDASGATLLRPNSCRIKYLDAALRSVTIRPDSIVVDVRNAGLGIVQAADIAVEIEGRSVASGHISALLPYSDTTIVFAIDLKRHIGLSAVTAAVALEGDKNPANDTARTTIYSSIPFGAVAINEIMYQPAIGDCEWIELANGTDSSVSLRQCTLAVAADSIEIPECAIDPRSFAIIAANSSFLTDHPDLLGRTGIAILGRSSLSLGDDSTAIALFSSIDTPIDTVYYKAAWQNAFVSDGHGVSLERRSVSISGTDSLNWVSSSDPRGSTPLAANSTKSQPENTGNEILVRIDPNPVRAGNEIPSTIGIQLSPAQGLLRVRIFAAAGRAVRVLTDGELWSGEAKLTFDGEDDEGRALPPGLYTLLVEITDSNGVTSSKRAGIVIAPN